eukprot:TRINITY_DN7340_c1_g1_i1.p1 TRINITY_DN7340_c1_g1~~TRINITY_DN7340_c1_g1_i1.p1  ORF type:complete len:816 (-),score=228.71 TRINITY_DN7340_c1_g1_i1:563-3010(-)
MHSSGEAPSGGDYLSEKYQQKADGQLFVEAEQLLGAEDFTGAAAKAKQAYDQFKASGDATATADAMRALVFAMVGEGKAAEANHLAKEELSRYRGSGDRSGEAKMLVSLAESNTALDGKAKAEAMASAKEARSILKNLGDKRLEVKALLAMASVNMNKGAQDLGGVEVALKQASQAKELAKDVDCQRLEAESLHALAECQALVGCHDDALEAADEAMDLYLELRDKRREAFELLRMANWNLKLGDQTRALSDAEDALEIYQMLGSSREVEALRMVFDTHMARSDLRKARLVAAEALRRFREEGKKEGQVQASIMLVELYLKANRFDEALTAAKRGITICKELEDRAGQASLMCVIARARTRMGQPDKAIAIAKEAWSILQELPAPSEKSKNDKIEIMNTMADCALYSRKIEGVRECAEEFREHFNSREDGRGEGYSLLLLATAMFKLGNEDASLSHAQRAQALFSDEGDAKGEADSLKMIGELHWKKNEYKVAVRYGERARALYREAEKLDGEVACMYMISENAVRHSVKEGARIYSETPVPRQAKDALDKGIKIAEAAIKIARSGNLAAPELLGSLLCARAQGLTLKARFEEALNCADEAVMQFRELGAYQMEANALMLACDNLRALQQIKEAAEAVDEALALYKHVEDEVGEKLALEVIDSFKEFMQPQQPQYMPPPGAPAALPQGPSVFDQAAQQAALEAGQMARPGAGPMISRGPAGPALDVKAGLTLDVVKSKVLEIAMRITGADDDEIQADTPLMEAGLTSNSAILMRDELGAALPGVSLPVTLVFDYPSVAAMAELVVESTGGKAIGN